MNPEQFNPARKLSQEEIKELKSHEEERDVRAEERNRYRTVWQKVLGREKTSEMDIAIEEASQMDAEIDRLIDDGKAASASEAIQIIEEEGNFELKGKERIGKEEWARFRTLQFGGALEENDFAKAREIIRQSQREEKADDETKQILNETIAPVITSKLTELVENKDGKNFVRAFDELSELQPITAEDLPQENLQSPEIQGAIKEDLIKRADVGPITYSEMRDKLASGGVIDAEKFDQLPEVQDIIKTELIKRANVGPHNYSSERDRWVDKGVIDAEKFDQLPEVQDIIKTELIKRANVDPHNYSSERDRWVDKGVIDAEKFDQLPEVQDIIKTELIKLANVGPHNYSSERDRWVDKGVIDAEETNKWPEIIEALGRKSSK